MLQIDSSISYTGLHTNEKWNWDLIPISLNTLYHSWQVCSSPPIVHLYSTFSPSLLLFCLKQSFSEIVNIYIGNTSSALIIDNNGQILVLFITVWQSSKPVSVIKRSSQNKNDIETKNHQQNYRKVTTKSSKK